MVAPGLPRWLGRAVSALAMVYLAAVWLDAVGSHVPDVLPRPARFFVQVAQLFPRAAEQIIEWHVKGYRCASGRFEELDVRPYFPLHADDKENRFDRAMFFYFKTPTVQRALDRYISERKGQRGPELRIGGVMLMSARLPLPAPGDAVERYRRRPVAELGHAAELHHWYVTGPDERVRRCAESP